MLHQKSLRSSFKTWEFFIDIALQAGVSQSDSTTAYMNMELQGITCHTGNYITGNYRELHGITGIYTDGNYIPGNYMPNGWS